MFDSFFSFDLSNLFPLDFLIEYSLGIDTLLFLFKFIFFFNLIEGFCNNSFVTSIVFTPNLIFFLFILITCSLYLETKSTKFLKSEFCLDNFEIKSLSFNS